MNYQGAEDDDLLDEDTMDFVLLWDYVRSLDIISAEDVVLLDELVIGQNFSIALDLLRERTRPYSRNFPVEMADIARRPHKKCIRVRDIDGRKLPSIKQLPPPHPHNIPPMPIPPSPWSNIVSSWEKGEKQAADERQRLRIEQDEAYLESARIDFERQFYNDDDNVDEPGSAAPVFTPLPLPVLSSVPRLDKPPAPICTPLPPPVLSAVPKIDDEEPPLEDGDVVSVLVMTSHGRMERRFRHHDRLEKVAAWAKCRELSTNYPTRSWPLSTLLQDTPIQRKRVLLIAASEIV